MDLSIYIDPTSSDILNTNGKLDDVVIRNPAETAGPLKGISSDTDPQILISLQFKSSLKITSIKFECPTTAQAPKTVKLFVNKINLGFSDVEELTPTQELTLTGNDVKPSGDPSETATKISAAKFSKVTSLVIFVEGNQSDGENEVTKIGRILFFGASPDTPPSNVIHITSVDDYKARTSGNDGKLVVAYFNAAWCTACKTTGPIVHKLSMEHPTVSFLSIDVDKLKALPEAANLSSIPHFKVYQGGKMIAEKDGIPEEILKVYGKKHTGGDGFDRPTGASRDPSGL